ncbi:uncharacterized protein LOC133175230 [Saccostrea echinata]|uniref:uncharacterized protein LOC133175230 n=1 Tax=Saccostrea echinata TaxID=191078 RepID=UPI002A82152A|nr:uncharacterized protein LOC133175230 [Saccostrea echinata]
MAVKRVAVIGAGAAGLCSVRHLSASPDLFSVVCFELSSTIGGTWNYTDNTGKDKNGLPIQSSMYKNLRTNLPKEVMAFPNFPFQASLPSYITHESVLEYLKSYSDYYNLHKHIKLNTMVTTVKSRPCEGSREFWDVSYCAVDDQSKVHSEEFDAVMVCNGHYSLPLYPTIPGMESFQGQVIHSHDYRSPELFRNKRVVCLGAAASGQDIAIDVSHEAKIVYLSHNKPPLQTYLPNNVQQKPGIKELGSKSVIFNNGDEAKIDVLLLCTGYHYHFPFLSDDCQVQISDERLTPLYKHLIHIDHPTMAFIGIPKTICPFPQFDVQVRFFLSSLSGKIKLPSGEEMKQDMECDFERRLALGFPPRYAHVLGPRQWEYNDELAELAGVELIPRVVQNLYDYVHETRVKDIVHYKDNNYELVDSERFRNLEKES